nr:immunoglobulin lambda-like polypeptide 1 isoform X3 [Columba livia]
MAWLPLLLAVLAHGSGSLVQAALTQPPSVSTTLGETVRIECSGLSSGSNAGWYQQKVPGTGPVTLIYNSNQRPSGIPSRFSGTRITWPGAIAEDKGAGSFVSWSAAGSQGESCSVVQPSSAHPGNIKVPGSLVQAALAQPPSVSTTLGETVRIECSELGSAGWHYAGWYQQKIPGTAPVTVIYGGNRRPSSIPSRFSGTKSGTTATLTIAGVQAEDEAVYYCGGWDSNNNGIFGAGTQLTISNLPRSAPEVSLFPPSSELLEQNKATLVCLIENFYPRDVTVAWLADGNTITDGVSTSQPQWQSNTKYMASSYLTLTPSQWRSKETFTCKVTHAAGNVQKTVKRSECSS